MSFDYLDDLFGKERPTTPRYAAVEQEAQYRDIEQMNFDGQWMERCRRCLEELIHKTPAANEEQAENDNHA